MSKYHNHPVVIAGIKFDSRLEGDRFLFLKNLERQGIISELKMQVTFEVIPQQTVTIPQIGKRGLPIKPKVKVLEQNTEYIADFTYRLKDGRLIVEDTKGEKTADYIIKRKLMRLQGNPITEVSHPTQLITTDRRDFINIPYEEEQK